MRLCVQIGSIDLLGGSGALLCVDCYAYIQASLDITITMCFEMGADVLGFSHGWYADESMLFTSAPALGEYAGTGSPDTTGSCQSFALPSYNLFKLDMMFSIEVRACGGEGGG